MSHVGIYVPAPGQRALTDEEKRHLSSTVACSVCQRGFSFMNHPKPLECGHKYCEPCFLQLKTKVIGGRRCKPCPGCEREDYESRGGYSMTSYPRQNALLNRRVRSADRLPPRYPRDRSRDRKDKTEIFEKQTTTRLITTNKPQQKHVYKPNVPVYAAPHLPGDTDRSSITTTTDSDSTIQHDAYNMNVGSFDIRPHHAEHQVRGGTWIVKSFQVPHVVHSLALLGLDSMVTCNRKKRTVEVYDCSGQRKRQIRGADWHRLNNPIFTATDGENRIAICDLPNSSSPGRTLFYGLDGRMIGQFMRTKVQFPLSIDLKADERSGDTHVLIADRESRLVFLEKPDGCSVPVLSPRGKFSMPGYVRFLGRSHLAVSDSEEHVVYIFDTMGRLQFTVGRAGEPGDGPGLLCKPKGVCEASDGFLIADKGNDRIVHVSKEGRLMGDFLNHRDGIVQPTDIMFNKWGELAVACQTRDTPFIRVFSFGDV